MREAKKTDTQVGQRFNRLTIIEQLSERSNDGYIQFRCLCDCGKQTITTGSNLRSGRKKSCGCLHKDTLTTHGLSESPEYEAWRAMRNRCYREKDEHFSNYGGRGITVCDEWRNDFSAFYAHVGPRPSPKHSIHRKENNGNYESGNVVWTTQDVQCNNRTSSRMLEHAGKTQTLMQWSRETGLNHNTIALRIKAGWSVERALTAPIQKLKRRMI